MLRTEPERLMKLRTSCDGCGAAKLRCDRGQPECQRCANRAMTCVYGVSRKMGKPPRQKLNSSPAHTTTVTSASSTNPVASEASDSSTGTTRSTSSTAGDDLPMLHLVDDSFDYSAPPPLSAFLSLDLPEWPTVEQFNTSLFPNSPPSYDLHFAAPSVQPSKTLPATGQILPHHDCSRKAYSILGRLSMFDDRSLGTASAAEEVPFDHVLRLNREASDQLSKLLTCSCAPCPSLAFLKASIISKILSWYHQAAICMQIATSRMTAIPNSVTPTSIAVGTFSVDDERVQAALKIQLLLGEMRRAGHLITEFMVHGTDSTYYGDSCNPENVDSLRQHLTTWLKDEHSRIVNIMKSKLRELNS